MLCNNNYRIWVMALSYDKNGIIVFQDQEKKSKINHIHTHKKQVDKIKKKSTNDRDLPWLRNNFLRNAE